MFQVKIIDVKATLYESLADGVYFNVNEEGQRGILTNHINEEFKISPSCIYIFNKDQKIKLFIGYGYAKMFNNVLEITGAPISTSMEDFTIRCNAIGSYGASCLKNFIHINL